MADNDEIEALETEGQKWATKRWNRFFFSREIIRSKAFAALRSATAHRVLMVFYSKCQWKRVQGSARRQYNYYHVNQGEIQFTYTEAVEKWRISRSAFRTAIDNLIETGFIDIAKQGSGLQKDVTLYGISERWRAYGTPDFVQANRPKRGQRYGFTKGNRYGRNNRK